MLSLQELFHSLPYELKEKILSFTYKQQPKNLMAEIREFNQAKEYLQELTLIIDQCNSSYGMIETSDNIYDTLWCGLYFIINACHKDILIKTWKYKNDIKSTELAHANGNKTFRLLDWKKSFALSFWMGIYH
jgi:hypothetical protein